MEEIRKAAKAVYDNSSDEAKKEMEDLFRSTDKNGDGKISLQEFMTSSIINNTCTAVLRRKFFKLIDQNGGDGTLQFDEFVTLVYLSSSPRPWCDGCGDFIGGEFVHEHTDFVDNYSLLAMMRAEEISSSQSSDGSRRAKVKTRLTKEQLQRQEEQGNGWRKSPEVRHCLTSRSHSGSRHGAEAL
ncbi:hypothetical protein K1719_039242 [Acacia pycnantha]|nr:hypothetical protein K1719_039242 [Acacia pycnantha]